MMPKLLTGVFVTAVAAMPLAARADWDNLKERGAGLEQQGKDLQQKGKDMEKRGADLKTKGDHAHDEAVSDYHKGQDGYRKTEAVGSAVGSKIDHAFDHNQNNATATVDQDRTTVRHDGAVADRKTTTRVRHGKDYAKRTTTTTTTHRHQ